MHLIGVSNQVSVVHTEQSHEATAASLGVLTHDIVFVLYEDADVT